MTTATTAAERRRARQEVANRRTRVLLLPLVFIVALAATAGLPTIRQNPSLFGSVLGAAAVLLLGLGALSVRAGRRALSVTIDLRKQHYLQACAQSTVLLYWGYYWRPVYDALPLIAVQLIFAYAFDMLLAWSRRDDYTFGFAPFPVIFSTNLFLWFKPEWFYLQFLMVAVGFAAKELIRWNRDGRRVHIFNPSSFPLAVFSLWLIASGNTSMTLGAEIATTQFAPPNMYLLLFLVGLPGQLLFGVTTMTMSAVVTTYLFGLAYFAVTGTYFFIDSYIPIAVFLGMHLLFTDPSTSPRSELGRIAFGVIYGLSNVALYALLGVAGVPRFYDKLLPVPLMNLSVRFIDRAVTRLRAIDVSRLAPGIQGRRRNLVYVLVWSSVFVVLSATDGVGDHHPGHKVAFWQDACSQDRPGACRTLGGIFAQYCLEGSGWACNERGVLRSRRDPAATDQTASEFLAACTRGFSTGCRNAAALKISAVLSQSPPTLKDYPIILRAGKAPLVGKNSVELLTLACDDGWMSGCNDLAGFYLRGDGVPREAPRATTLLAQACDGGFGQACSNLGLMYYKGDGVVEDRGKGLGYLKQGCEKGYAPACSWLKDVSVAEPPVTSPKAVP